MPFSPRATAILLLSITIPAIMLALIYRRRVWCRYLCPLGKLVGFLSRCSILELRANHNICNNDCMENSCYVGKANQAGCPVFEAPFVLHNNQDCILCGNCVKNCANQVPVLNLRVPGQELWTFRKPDLTMAFLVSIIMGAQFFRGIEKTGYLHKYAAAQNQPWIFYSVLIVVSTSLAFLFIKMAGKMVFGSEKTSSRLKSNLVAYAIVPMVVIFELSFHFERMISRGGQVFPALGRQLGVDWNFLMVSMGPLVDQILPDSIYSGRRFCFESRTYKSFSITPGFFLNATLFPASMAHTVARRGVYLPLMGRLIADQFRMLFYSSQSVDGQEMKLFIFQANLSS